MKDAVHGNPDLVGNFELAMSIMEQQMSSNIGEVEDMLQATTGLLREADLENGVANEKANAKFVVFGTDINSYSQGEDYYLKMCNQ